MEAKPLDGVDVSVVIPVLNEEQNIERCLTSVDWAREVIVVDGGSSDNTRELAARAGARVLQAQQGTIGAQRNAGARIASCPWILALDADERAQAGLAAEVREAVTRNDVDAFVLPRANYFLGRLMRSGGWGRDRVVRLYRAGLDFNGRWVHETLDHAGPTPALSIGIDHFPYPDRRAFESKLERYARWGARDLIDAGRKARLIDLMIRPPMRFLRIWLLQGAILEGRHGLLLSWFAARAVAARYRAARALSRQMARA